MTSSPPRRPGSGVDGTGRATRPPRLHRPVRPGQDHDRRRRPRGRAARGPRSTATSTASPRSCGAPSPSSSTRITAVRGRRRRTPSRRSPTRSSRVVVTGARELVDHDALQFLLAHEPEADRSATSRSVPATASSSRVGDALAPAFAPLAVADDAHACRRLARPHRSAPTCSCRNRRSISPTPSSARDVPRDSS